MVQDFIDRVILGFKKTQSIHIEDDFYVFGGWGLFEDFADVF